MKSFIPGLKSRIFAFYGTFDDVFFL